VAPVQVWSVGALTLLAAVAAALFWLRPDNAYRMQWVWVLASLAISLGVTALLNGRGIFLIGALPLIGFAAGRRQQRATFKSASPRAPAVKPAMTRAEALAVLGLPPSATREEAERAYRQMMEFADPDHGGSQWLVDRLNEARAVLLER